jgi:hypothetical protein
VLDLVTINRKKVGKLTAQVLLDWGQMLVSCLTVHGLDPPVVSLVGCLAEIIDISDVHVTTLICNVIMQIPTHAHVPRYHM